MVKIFALKWINLQCYIEECRKEATVWKTQILQWKKVSLIKTQILNLKKNMLIKKEVLLRFLKSWKFASIRRILVKAKVIKKIFHLFYMEWFKVQWIKRAKNWRLARESDQTIVIGLIIPVIKKLITHSLIFKRKDCSLRRTISSWTSLWTSSFSVASSLYSLWTGIATKYLSSNK